MKFLYGRHLFGLAAITFGLICLACQKFNTWQQIQPLGNIPNLDLIASMVGFIELVGGILIQWKKTARAGAIMLGIIYLGFALLWIPVIVTTPQVYDHWGNFFEQFSLFSGALIVSGAPGADSSEGTTAMGWLGHKLFGICVISFTLEQLFYLSGTASLVPKWLPPSQMFWAITTTIAFALAAIAILSGRPGLLASRLLAAMIICFEPLVWLPALFADPHKMLNWAGNAENLAIAGASWIVADYLS